MSIAAGTQQRVNTTTENFQGNPVIASLTDGGWVVAWQSLGQDGSDHGVYLQRYDADGVAVSVETLVNVYTYLDQAEPSITGLANGGWAVTWMSYYQDSNGWSSFQQAYDLDGNVVWDEDKINYLGGTVTTGLADGRWVALTTDLPPGRPSFITRVLGVDSGRFRVGQARRARSPQIAQAPGALLLDSDCPVRNAA